MSDPGGSPDRPRDLWTSALVVASVAAIAFLLVQILLYSYGRDQGIYAVVADAILRGGMPYRDVWDFKPPGIFVVFALSRAVLGPAMWAVRAVECAALASMVVAFVLIAGRFFGDRRVGVIGGALGVLAHAQLDFWHTAQPESFGAVAIAWAIALGTVDSGAATPPRRAAAAHIGAGLLFGAAFLLKPTLGGVAAVTAIFAWRRARTSGASVAAAFAPGARMAGGAVAAVGACALWFAAKGAWRDLHEALFVFAPEYTRLGWRGMTVQGAFYYALEEGFVTYSSAGAVGILAAVLLPPAADREREGVLHVLLAIAVVLAGVAAQAKFFPYHYGAALPLVGLLAGLGAWKLWNRSLRLGPWGVAAFAVGAFVVLKTRSATRDTETDYLDRCERRTEWLLSGARDRAALDALDSVADVNLAANREVARWLREATEDGARVLVWGFEPVVYDLSGRRPATRFLYDVPQRAAWSRDAMRARLMDDLARTPPRAIVVEHRDVFPVVTGDALDSAAALRSFPELRALVDEGFDHRGRIEDFDLYLTRAPDRGGP